MQAQPPVIRSRLLPNVKRSSDVVIGGRKTARCCTPITISVTRPFAVAGPITGLCSMRVPTKSRRSKGPRRIAATQEARNAPLCIRIAQDRSSRRADCLLCSVDWIELLVLDRRLGDRSIEEVAVVA